MHITVDGRTILNADPQYIGTPPPELTPQALRAGGTTADPWKLALLPTFAAAAMSQTAANIDITTDGRNFTMNVTYPD